MCSRASRPWPSTYKRPATSTSTALTSAWRHFTLHLQFIFEMNKYCFSSLPNRADQSEHKHSSTVKLIDWCLKYSKSESNVELCTDSANVGFKRNVKISLVGRWCRESESSISTCNSWPASFRRGKEKEQRERRRSVSLYNCHLCLSSNWKVSVRVFRVGCAASRQSVNIVRLLLSVCLVKASVELIYAFHCETRESRSNWSWLNFARTFRKAFFRLVSYCAMRQCSKSRTTTSKGCLIDVQSKEFWWSKAQFFF